MSNKYTEAILKAPDQYPEIYFDIEAQNHFDDPGELYKIAEAYCLVGHFEDACILYRRIVELNPSWSDILDIYARALWALHDYEGARRLWKLFLDRRKQTYLNLGIPLSFYTVDDVFTSAFGNFTHYYPMDKYGYLTNFDRFYYHKTLLSDGQRSVAPIHGGSVCNRAMRDYLFTRISDDIPQEILILLSQDDYVTRLPFYCGTDLNRRPTHFHQAFAEKMLKLSRSGAEAKLRFEPEHIDDCEHRLARIGVDLNRPIVCMHARESGYWGRTGDRTHSTKNADIASYIPAVEFLTKNGCQVVRLGDASMKPLPTMRFVFDYALSEYKSEFVDLYLLTRSKFLMCTSSGPFTVASMFNIPVLATNWVSSQLLPFLPKDLVLFKEFKYRSNGRRLSYDDLLRLDYGEFGYYNFQRKNIELVDNTADELRCATVEMLERLDAKEEADLVKANCSPASICDRSWVSRFGNKPIVSEAQFVRGTV